MHCLLYIVLNTMFAGWKISDLQLCVRRCHPIKFEHTIDQTYKEPFPFSCCAMLGVEYAD